MGERKPLTVDDAYALETPDDSIRLYDQWAETYESDFIADSGYVLYCRVAEVFVQQGGPVDGAVLDIGCGTGVVGVCLRDAGVQIVDGIDISPLMLDEARNKTMTSGDSVYRQLIAADLTKSLDMPDNQYAGLVSAGTFTHGHLGPETLDNVWRLAAPGARCAISVKTTHFESGKFDEKLSCDVADGIITRPELIEVDVYSAETGSVAHADDKAYVVVCQVAK